jgi:hypothetical protein
VEYGGFLRGNMVIHIEMWWFLVKSSATLGWSGVGDDYRIKRFKFKYSQFRILSHTSTPFFHLSNN